MSDIDIIEKIKIACILLLFIKKYLKKLDIINEIKEKYWEDFKFQKNLYVSTDQLMSYLVLYHNQDNEELYNNYFKRLSEILYNTLPDKMKNKFKSLTNTRIPRELSDKEKIEKIKKIDKKVVELKLLLFPKIISKYKLKLLLFPKIIKAIIHL